MSGHPQRHSEFEANWRHLQDFCLKLKEVGRGKGKQNEKMRNTKMHSLGENSIGNIQKEHLQSHDLKGIATRCHFLDTWRKCEHRY